MVQTRLPGPLKLYLRYASVSIQGQMQFRASFIMMSFGSLLTTGTEFVGIWALIHRFGSLRGWSLAEIGVFYGVINVAFAISEAIARGFDLFPSLVKSGDFDRFLLRPQPLALQVIGTEIQLMRVGRLAQGLAVLLWSALRVPAAQQLPGVLLILTAIASGAVIFTGLFIVQATIAFWTIESLEIMNTVTYGGTETAQYPLHVYRPWFRRFFTFVIPLACANYLPMDPIFHPAGGSGYLGAVASPLVACTFLAVCMLFWGLGVRHYHSTGS